MDVNRSAERRRDLTIYESLLDSAERLKPSGLRFDELRELGVLYRRHLTHLARLRERGTDPDGVAYLNALSVRAYTLLYGARPQRAASTENARTLADTLARGWAPLRIAFALLAMGTFLGGALTLRDTQVLWTLMPSSMGYTPIMLEELATSATARDQFLERSASDLGAQALFGSSLFAHNTRVGILALAVGVLAGIPTVLLTLYNGLILGAFGSVFVGGGATPEFLAWILPHGIPEFTAISLCAAGGLVSGKAVVAPGRLHRRDALREAMGTALVLFGTAVPLFFIAAILESFVRESMMTTEVRLTIAAAEFAILALGVASVRKLARRRPSDLDWLGELRQDSP